MSINLLGAFKCARLRCKTCSFIHNVEKISEPKTSIKIMQLLHNLHLMQKVIHWWNRKTTRWPIPGTPSQRRAHSNQSLDTQISLTIQSSIRQFAAFSNIQAVRKATKLWNKSLPFKSTLLVPTVSSSTFHSTNLFLLSRHHIPTNSVAPFFAYKPTHIPQFLQSLWRRANCLRWPIYVNLSTQLIILNYPAITISAWIRIKIRIILRLFWWRYGFGDCY